MDSALVGTMNVTEEKATERSILGVKSNGGGEDCDHDCDEGDCDCKEKSEFCLFAESWQRTELTRTTVLAIRVGPSTLENWQLVHKLFSIYILF